MVSSARTTSAPEAQHGDVVKRQRHSPYEAWRGWRARLAWLVVKYAGMFLRTWCRVCLAYEE